MLQAGQTPPWAETRGTAPPFALVESGAHGLTLAAVDERAWREGLRPGLALADARAALPSLSTAPAEREADDRALRALASWCGRYGSARNVEDNDGVWIDTTGVAHLFGGEQAMLADLVRRLARAGITARAGLADTPGAAFALARFATSPATPSCIASTGAARERLAPLPVEALRLPSAATVLLGRLGLRRIGQLYAVPREALAQRFRSAPAGRAGARRREREAMLMAGTVLARLDRALGLAAEPRAPLTEPARHIARRLFAEPLVTATGVAAALDDLARDLACRLEVRGEGGTRFVLALYRADGSSQEVSIGASRPCRDARHLIALFSEKLDRLDAGFGIDAMTLAAPHTEPYAAHQPALLHAGAAASEAAASALVDRLSSRLGAARVFRLAAADSHIPERGQRRLAALATPSPQALSHRLARQPRPVLLLPMPEPIIALAEVPDGPPRLFTWRRLVHRIARAEGPERIEPEWWRAIGRAPDRAAAPHAIHLARPRDYYRLEDEQGGRFWVFRAGLYGRDEAEGRIEDDAEAVGDEVALQGVRETFRPVWFMHGVFG